MINEIEDRFPRSIPFFTEGFERLKILDQIRILEASVLDAMDKIEKVLEVNKMIITGLHKSNDY